MLLRETRNYVSNYHYNLHTQVFIERTSQTKQIKTIGVNQMLYSIRTHGVGIMNTVMKKLFKFIATQINNLSTNFLLDPTIKNLLSKEAKQFRKTKDKLRGMYPAKNAHELARKLKTLVNGKDYLNLLRERITQIGNTLGFVRMIRNASLKDNNNLLKFIPKKLEEYSFGEAAEELAIGGETLEAAAMFDKSVSLLFKQADDANDYLRKMVERIAGFADEDEERKFLKNFFVVVPALTTCYIEVIQNAKEKLMKHDDSDAFISDDGFSLGVVYLLKVLGVTDNFNALNWFDSMEKRLSTEQKKNEEKRSGAKAN